jgi:hypothetical protein
VDLVGCEGVRCGAAEFAIQLPDQLGTVRGEPRAMRLM